MRRLVVAFVLGLLLGIIATSPVQARHRPHPTPTPTIAATVAPTISGYTFDDEGDSLANWRTADYIGGGQEATFAASQASVSNGVLSLTAIRNGSGWLSSNLTTDPVFRQLYGHFEASIRIPKGTGLWPAFWFLDRPWSMAGELDAMEVCANQIGAGLDAGWLNSTVHYPPGQSAYGLRAVDLSLAFHVYGMDWRADHVAFSLDGREFARYTGPNIPTFAMPVILDLAVGGGWCGHSDATTPSPAVMEVDWVKVQP